MTVCTRLLVLVVFVAAVSVAASVREWKNFENGKVYSHRKLNSKKQDKSHVAHRGPVVEERMLHGHHRDKKAHHQLKSNRLQIKDTDHEKTELQKEFKSKNVERHRKKNVEEEMHLKPLNERHHKFPNPALLNKVDDSKTASPQITKQKLIKQVKSRVKTNGKRMLRGQRYKRNRTDQKIQAMFNDDAITEATPKKVYKIKTEAKHMPHGEKETDAGKVLKQKALKKLIFYKMSHLCNNVRDSSLCAR